MKLMENLRFYFGEMLFRKQRERKKEFKTLIQNSENNEIDKLVKF